MMKNMGYLGYVSLAYMFYRLSQMLTCFFVMTGHILSLWLFLRLHILLCILSDPGDERDVSGENG